MCANVFLLSIREKINSTGLEGGRGKGEGVVLWLRARNDLCDFFATLGSGRSCIIHTLLVHKVDLLTTCLFERTAFWCCVIFLLKIRDLLITMLFCGRQGIGKNELISTQTGFEALVMNSKTTDRE